MPILPLLALALAPKPPLLALHAGADDQTAQYEAFGRWLGRPVMARVTFCADGKWSDIAHPYFLDATERWVESRPGRIEIVSVPLIPREEGERSQAVARGDEADREAARRARRARRGRFDAVAEGAHDAEFRALGKEFRRRDIDDRVVVRLAWEYNGNWYPWSVDGDPEGFRRAFRRAVTALRGEAPKLRIDLCVSCKAATGTVWRDAYPGDDVVDVISLDVYDHYNAGWNDLLAGEAGLRAYRAFARAHRKPEAYPEWGVSTDTHGNGDAPAFVDRMADWFADAPGPVLYQGYWNTPSGGPNAAIQGEGAGRVPRTAEAFRRRFGRGSPMKGVGDR